jgi:multidrug efflux pump subunit AcrA (membrane-fusion protein)
VIAGSFPNPENLLRPGQFGRIKAEAEVSNNVILIPQQALNELQRPYQVCVVRSDNMKGSRPKQLAVRNSRRSNTHPITYLMACSRAFLAKFGVQKRFRIDHE